MKHCPTKSFTEQTYLIWAIKHCHIFKCVGLPVLTNGFPQTTWDNDPSAGSAEDWIKQCECWTRTSPWLALVCHSNMWLYCHTVHWLYGGPFLMSYIVEWWSENNQSVSCELGKNWGRSCTLATVLCLCGSVWGPIQSLPAGCYVTR